MERVRVISRGTKVSRGAHVFRVFRLGKAAVAAATIALDALAAGVIPDGVSITTVTTAPDGRITVGIAAPVGGVSTNSYREFNIPRAGVDLDNHAAHARTILNQVTSTKPSLLEGPLSVLGARANVVISNPNGLSVNGLIVQNVGHLASLWAAGKMSPRGSRP